jgi:ABC-type glycerol-3-phosphate transport system substrate-binding protein
MMEKKMNCRVLSVCALALIVLFSACSGKKESGSAGTAAAGPINIVVWEMYGPNNNFPQATDLFNKSQSEVSVTDEFIPSHTELVQKVQVSAAAGSELPHVILVDMFYAPVINELTGLVDLNPYLESDPSIDADDFYENLKNYSNIDGKQISLHAYANNIILFYNKKLFKDAGLDPEKPPVTWTDLIDYGQKLSQAGILPLIFDFTFNTYYEIFSWEFQVFVWQNGGEMWDANWQPKFNSPEGIEALQFIVDLINKYKITTLAPPSDAFDQGKAAMLIDGCWDSGKFVEGLGADLGAGPLPYSKIPATNTGGEHLMIVPSDKVHEDASWKYVSFMLSEPAEILICSTGKVPTRKSIANSTAYQAYTNKDPGIKAAFLSMPNARMRAASPNYGAASEAMSTPIQQAIFGKMSSAEAVQAGYNAFLNAINKK